MSVGNSHGVSWEYLSYLQAEGVEIRLHRPPSIRGIVRRGFGQLNQRMHSKVITNASGEMVTGGRNLREEYFNLSPELDNQHHDIDALVKGKASLDGRAYQELLWKSDVTEPLRPHRLRPHEIAGFQKKHGEAMAYFVDNGLIPEAPRKWTTRLRPIEDAKFIFDHQLPENGRYAGSQDSLVDLLRMAEPGEELLMENQYFIPDKELVAEFKAAADRGVKVKVLANGWEARFAGGDGMVKTIYESMLSQLAEAGIEVREFAGPGRIHSKQVVLGRRQCNVWSHNIDNRSKVLNLEAGVRIIDKEFCSKLADRIDQRFAMGKQAVARGRLARKLHCPSFFLRITSHMMRPNL